MRLIGTVQSEKLAFQFYSFLLAQGIESSYEVSLHSPAKEEEFLLWVYDEDLFEKAYAFFQDFEKDPTAPLFNKIPIPSPPAPPLIAHDKIDQKEDEEVEPKKVFSEIKEKPGILQLFFSTLKKQKQKTHPITSMILCLCIFCYIWNIYEREPKRYPPSTSLEKALIFDYTLYQAKLDALLHATVGSAEPDPAKLQDIEKIPHWQGAAIYLNNLVKEAPSPSFSSDFTPEKIVDSHQWWRLFTPVLLHRDFFHILFNILLAFALLKQVEERISHWKMVFLILAIGVISNSCQYVIGGPNFLGFSGIVCGLVGFIRIRQKVAPWEGYPMSRGFFTFIITYIIAMALLEIGSIEIFTLFGSSKSGGIANTAHITGTLFGALLGRLPLFARKFR